VLRNMKWTYDLKLNVTTKRYERRKGGSAQRGGPKNGQDGLLNTQENCPKTKADVSKKIVSRTMRPDRGGLEGHRAEGSPEAAERRFTERIAGSEGLNRLK